MTRALFAPSLAGICVAVLALGGCAAPVRPTPDPVPRPVTDARPAGLSVDPATALFDVTLRPGEVHVAQAAVTNDASTPLTVAMTTVVDRADGTGGAVPDALVSARLGEDCATLASGDGRAVVVGSPRSLPLGTVVPDETTTLCGVIALPADTALPSGASVTFSVVLASVERPAARAAGDDPWRPDVAGRTGLARHALPGAAALAAGALLATALLLKRRRPGTELPDHHQPTTEDPA